MTRKNFLKIAALSSLVLFMGMSGCPPSYDESQSDFFVQSAFGGYNAQGWGWKPNSKVSIEIFNEPDGPGSANTAWKHMYDVDVDQWGMFGFTTDFTPPYRVERRICGTPEQNQTALVMAKNLTTGKIRMRQVPVDIYFTFQPCR